jgi:hypothetical protein
MIEFALALEIVVTVLAFFAIHKALERKEFGMTLYFVLITTILVYADIRMVQELVSK